jgi:hypothetical protein
MTKKNLPAVADPDLEGSDLAFTYKTLQSIINTELVPKEYRGNVPMALAAILTGRELGLGPMTAMRYIDVIDGRPSPSAEYMVSKIFEAGHLIYASALSDTSCTVVGVRRENGETVLQSEYTFDITMAERAGITRGKDGVKANWKHYPEAMLYWRAASQLARFMFADCIAGLSHLAIEIDLDAEPDDIIEAGDVIEPPAIEEAEVVEAIDLDEEARDAQLEARNLLEWELSLDGEGRVKCQGACEKRDPWRSGEYCCQDAHLRRIYRLAELAFALPKQSQYPDLLHQALAKANVSHVGDLRKSELMAMTAKTKDYMTKMLYGPKKKD